jgi:N-acetylglutamate synthase-like GNAT family acetyltransferase
MIVRKATEADLPEYIKLAQAFHAASPMHGSIGFDVPGYSQFYLSSLQNDSIGIWLAEIENNIVGICGALVYPLYFNPSALVVQELWWWLTPASRGSGAGGQMFKQIEQWAKDKNASALFMIALEDNRAKKMENLYIRAGFKPMERTFIKEVTSWQ